MFNEVIHLMHIYYFLFFCLFFFLPWYEYALKQWSKNNELSLMKWPSQPKTSVSMSTRWNVSGDMIDLHNMKCERSSLNLWEEIRWIWYYKKKKSITKNTNNGGENETGYHDNGKINDRSISIGPRLMKFLNKAYVH